ncbi:MAG TPA: hypothetical protein VHJ77_21365 [Vicinamibacterales bacterium]|nr:hypothetical protein [Vicinamibacterales bacterium]
MRDVFPTDVLAGESITIERSDASVDDRGARWFHDWRRSDGEPLMAAARMEDGSFLLRAIDLADCVIDQSGTRVTVFVPSGRPADGVHHLLLDQVLPLVLSHRGEFVLHATGVVLPAGAVVFAADAGSGKSTLVAALGGRGAHVLGDDAVLLAASGPGTTARAAYPGLRLWPDALRAVFGEAGLKAGRSKRRLGPDTAGLTFAAGAWPVAAIYQLEPAGPREPVRIEPLSPREGAMALVRHAYIFDICDRGRLRRQLDRAIDCGRRTRVRRLVFPHALGRLGEVCAAVLGDV